jgi:hypothetical protein
LDEYLVYSSDIYTTPTNTGWSVLNDTNIGRFTCRNASVVDYCITSPKLLK